MSSDKQPRYVQVPQPYYSPALYSGNEDEIDLLALLQTLLKRKVMILGVTVICMLAAVAIALLSESVYKASARLLPPLVKDVQTFNQNYEEELKENSNSISTDSMYADYKRNAHSLSFKRAFFERENLAQQLSASTAGSVLSEDDLSKAFEEFLKILNISENKKFKDALTVSIEWHTAEGAAELVNKYVDFVAQRTLIQAVNNFEYVQKNRLNSFLNNITAKRKAAEQKKNRRIAQFEEALAIAESLNIRRPAEIIATDLAKEAAQGLSAQPLYHRGSKILAVELESLRNADRDAFIPDMDLGNLQEQVERIKLTVLDQNNMKAIRIDSEALSPLHRIKPRRSLIVVLGALLGFMLGIMGALLVEFVVTQRNKKELEPEEGYSDQEELPLAAGAVNQLIAEYEILAQQALNKSKPAKRQTDKREPSEDDKSDHGAMQGR